MWKLLKYVLFATVLLTAGNAFAVVCPANVTGISPSATSCYPLQETSGTVITDTIGSNNGTISGNYTLNQNGGITCNNSSNLGCDIETGTLYSNPQPMTIYFDFAGTSGGILQFGNTSSSSASASYYVVFLDTQGKLTFGVNNYGTLHIIQSPLAYADGNRHKGAVSIGAAGAKLYVDGSLVQSGPYTNATFLAGYWFFGGINNANWQIAQPFQYLNGSLFTFAWWNGTQLTDDQAVSLTGGNPSAISNSYCTFSNQLASLNPATSMAYANKNLTFTIQSLQNPGGGSNLPIGPSTIQCHTDSTGTILAGCQIQQGAHVNLSVGTGPQIPLIIPFATSCDLTAIMLSQTDPPEVVSAVAVAGPVFAGTTVTNPPAGTIGTATITSPPAYIITSGLASVTVDIGANGNFQAIQMAQNTTVNLTNFQSGSNFLIDTYENGTGGYSPTFTVPGGYTLVWSGGGSQPAMPSTSANTHVIWQFAVEGTTTVLGSISMFASGGGGTPGGGNGTIQYNNSGSFGGFTMSGDCTTNTATGAITCTKTNGNMFSSFATQNAPCAVAQGCTGTTSPALVAGTGIGITGSWPNQTIALAAGSIPETLTTAFDIDLGQTSGPVAQFTSGTTGTLTRITCIRVTTGGCSTAPIMEARIAGSAQTPNVQCSTSANTVVSATFSGVTFTANQAIQIGINTLGSACSQIFQVGLEYTIP